MILSLIGYMGSGKSLIANELKSKLDFEVKDLDDEISNKIGMSIPEVFEKKGEIYFRKVEKEVLEELVVSKNNMILALGGGTPRYYNNMEVINQHSVSVYLRAGVETLKNRLLSEKEKRPIISKIADEKLSEFIGSHLFERNHFYNQAKIIIDTDNLTPREVAEEIIKKLKKE